MSILRRSNSLVCHIARMEVDKPKLFLLAFLTLLVVCAWVGLIFLAITVTQTVVAVLEYCVEALNIP